MKKKSNSKKINLKIKSTEDSLFKKLTKQELLEIRGGSTTIGGTSVGDAAEIKSFDLGNPSDFTLC